MNIADLLVKTIEANTEFDQGDGGYDFRSKRKDIMFHHPDGRYFEITIGDMKKEEVESESASLKSVLSEIRQLSESISRVKQMRQISRSAVA